MEPQPSAKQWKFAFVAVLAVSASVFFVGLGTLGFLGPDEPRYAEVAREMFASGDYISTRLCGCLWFEKPVLLYWMSAAGYHLFGVNEFAARLPSALAALSTVAFIFFALRRLSLARLGLAASLVLATSGIFIAYARVATPDMLLTAAIAAALLAALLFTRASGRARTLYWGISWLLMGFGMLAKGLVGFLLVLAILAVYLIVSGQLRSVRWRDLVVGIVVFLLAAGTWYVPVIARHGWAFIDEFFIRHHFERYTTNEFGHPQPVYFFLLVALAGTAPWIPFLVPGIRRLRALKPRDSNHDAVMTMAWVWVAVPLLFFSVSESKLPGYILPIFPALAIIIGAEVEGVWSGDLNGARRFALWVTAFTLTGMGAGFLFFLDRESVNLKGWQTVLAWLPLALALASAAALVAHRQRALIAGAVGVVLALVLASVILLFPTLRDEVSLKSLSLEAAAALRPGEKIGFYLKKEFAPVFYADGRVLCDPRRGTTFYALHQDMVADALAVEPSLILITDSRWVEGLENDVRFRTEFIAAHDDSLALRVSLNR